MWSELTTDEETLVWKVLEQCSRKPGDERWDPADGVAQLLVGQGLLKIRKGGSVTITAKGRKALKRRAARHDPEAGDNVVLFRRGRHRW
jgi:hypothetical protein